MGLALLAQSSRLLKYWDQAFLMVVHLINHTPTKILDYDTPIHCFLCATPDYSNLKVFGCTCWPNLRPYNAHKLQFCSIRYAFLGYSNLHKGYKCLDIATGQVYISRDVVFDESIFPFAQLHQNSGTKYTSYVLLTQTHIQGEVQIYRMIIFLLTFVQCLLTTGLLSCSKYCRRSWCPQHLITDLATIPKLIRY
jgi:hypothetical protein